MVVVVAVAVEVGAPAAAVVEEAQEVVEKIVVVEAGEQRKGSE